MKKLLFYIISVIGVTALFNVDRVYAANALINVTSPSTTVEVGSKVTVYYTISSANALGAWNFQLVTPNNFKLGSCSDGLLAHHVGFAPNSNTKSFTITCTFTAQSSGYGNFTVKNYEVEGYTTGTMSLQIGPKTIRAMTRAEIQAGLSKNNNLKSLTVSGGELTPAFSKDTLIYNVTLEPETKSTSILASSEDTRSTIMGTGTHALEEGLNVFKINVKAQNGTIKTYTLNITVKELAPIEVTMNDVKYSVVRKKEEIKIPNKHFKETTVTIGEEVVPGFINEVTSVVLVGLKDEKGAIALYNYNEVNKSYSLYRDYTFSSLTLEILDNNKNIPSTYSLTEIEINKNMVAVYKLKSDSTYSLFNAINVATGEENLYMYDETGNTIMKYNNEEKIPLNKEISDLKKLSEKYEYVIIALGGFLTLTYFIMFVKLISGKKKKKRIDKKTESEEIFDIMNDSDDRTSDKEKNDSHHEDFLKDKKNKNKKK